MSSVVRAHSLAVKKRNGQQVPFFEIRITKAIESACKAKLGIPHEVELEPEWKLRVEGITDRVVKWCDEQASVNPVIFIEDIQNAVVQELRKNGLTDIAESYARYRHEQELRRFEAERITVQKRDGRVVSFKPEKIAIAIGKAFSVTREEGTLSPDTRAKVLEVADQVVAILKGGEPNTKTVSIENVQDLVEITLMEKNHLDVARQYIIYREDQRRKRDESVKEQVDTLLPEQEQVAIKKLDGSKEKLDIERIKVLIAEACYGLEDHVSVDQLLKKTLTNCYDGMPAADIQEAALLTARQLVEEEPTYNYVAGRILLRKVYRDVAGRAVSFKEMQKIYSGVFKQNIKLAVQCERLSPKLLEFDFDVLGEAIQAERDLSFTFMGLQTLYDRYFIHEKSRRLESPQIFWMRVSMGLAMNEGERKTERAIEFYNMLSTFRFISSTPTLFNSGTHHPQLSSCFLTTVGDDLDHIFKCVKDNALLSKWSGGLGNDWTSVRAMGSHIKGTNGNSQGVIPFMKVANDTAVAVNQGGKRQGAVCGYLECWHLDVEEFLELRKNTGDDRRRTHDMHTANWIPDLFMKRVLQNAEWSLFSSNETSDLHDLCGAAFEKRYVEYETKAKRGEMRQYKSIPAVALWRKMLSMLFETGHPWITFKDPCNVRSPQDHQGVVHSSNLCTEITLNTSWDETAVCNLGSVNLAVHTTPAGLDKEMLTETVQTAIRMLDNVIDINYYPTVEAKASNMRHRPVGMGLMGFQDALYIRGFSYASSEAVEFADESMELIAYNATLASSYLAAERGAYGSYQGSKWDRGFLPIDTIDLLEKERAGHLSMDRSRRLDWTPVRESIKKNGMRNSNTMAIAPTATIANITGVTQSIEPTYKNLFVKSNLSGEFTVSNPYLVNELKAFGLWDKKMVEDLKYFDGNLQEIDRIPQSVKDRYATAFEIGYEWIIECASRRQKWIDMGQSLNLYLAEPSGKKLHNMYLMAWEKGLKTTYYLRSLGATRVEKSTVDANRYGDPLGLKQKKPRNSDIINQALEPQMQVMEEGIACDINAGEDCEACQ
jgi:ribonucleoside-diphosphate reductase alpha chain